MSYLEVPAARLYYQTNGRGPLMLMIPGANGSADAFRGVADHLAAQCTVVTYDRRGFSRSHLAGPQDDARRLATDADDARRLIEHLSDEPAILFGSSSGAIVGLEVLTHHPDVVRRVVPLEPPAVKLLADGQQWMDFFYAVYALYRRSGVEPALKVFRERVFAESDRQAMARAQDQRNGQDVLANATYWFEHELRQYPAVDLDLDALRAQAERIVLVGGRESRGHPAYAVNVALGERLEREVIELPGGHLGFVTRPAAFARELAQALARTGLGLG